MIEKRSDERTYIYIYLNSHVRRVFRGIATGKSVNTEDLCTLSRCYLRSLIKMCASRTSVALAVVVFLLSLPLPISLYSILVC